ncbi:hypothetical protein M422DRAFT_166875 [Sphaerobolus stellatus SS14]|uniref:Uncharacterized protein n=1 Tax=Sphaerobolus stellatus (strain SS14) TaxID=990650 RepID=A0A0C9VEC9_SPHS4|nr:hypothetical protein M422DRAFT_166875 [Sphaerobolus stellatus SS14]
MSWWPKPNIWRHSGLDVGYWSSGCEKWFQDRKERIRKGDARLKSTEAWRSSLARNQK